MLHYIYLIQLPADYIIGKLHADFSFIKKILSKKLIKKTLSNKKHIKKTLSTNFPRIPFKNIPKKDNHPNLPVFLTVFYSYFIETVFFTFKFKLPKK